MNYKYEYLEITRSEHKDRSAISEIYNFDFMHSHRMCAFLILIPYIIAQSIEVTSTQDIEQTTCSTQNELNYWDRFYFRPDLIRRMRESKHIKIGALVLEDYGRYDIIQ